MIFLHHTAHHETQVPILCTNKNCTPTMYVMQSHPVITRHPHPQTYNTSHISSQRYFVRPIRFNTTTSNTSPMYHNDAYAVSVQTLEGTCDPKNNFVVKMKQVDWPVLSLIVHGYVAAYVNLDPSTVYLSDNHPYHQCTEWIFILTPSILTYIFEIIVGVMRSDGIWGLC
jgi:hypothetical protein